LKQGLIALQFRMMRDLTEAAQALEACIVEDQQGQSVVGKRKEVVYSLGKPPKPFCFKKGKGRQYN